MAKEFLPLFLDFNETTQDLSDAQCGHLIRALVDYANGKDPELGDGMELMAFRFLKGTGKKKPQMKVLPAQQYDQRDYSGVQAELMAEQDREMEEYMKKDSG